MSGHDKNPQEKRLGGINSIYSAGDFENSLFAIFFNPMQSSPGSLAWPQMG